MKKFILVRKGNYDPYYLITVLANSGVSSRFVDEKFQFYECNISFDTGRLVYIDDKDAKVFFQKLKEKNISFEILDLNEKYDEFTKSKCTPEIEKLDDSFFLTEKEKIKVITTIKIPKIIECSNGKQLLTEGKIVDKDGITLYIYSNEQSKHHKPHVHIAYNDDNNFLEIDLKNFEIIKQKKRNGNPKKVNKCIELVKEYITESRLEWNKSNARIKFKVNEKGVPTDETYDSLKI